MFITTDNDSQRSPEKTLQILLETSQHPIARPIIHTDNHLELFTDIMFEELQLTTIKKVINDSYKEIENVINDEIKLYNNLRISMGNTKALLIKAIEHLKRELKYKEETKETQVKANQIPNALIDTPNKQRLRRQRLRRSCFNRTRKKHKKSTLYKHQSLQ